MSKNQKQFYVSQMKQKAAIEVNEEGTKTTAVTVSMMAGLNIVNGKGEFHANRPFVYVIQEWSSGAIFFIGTFQGN
jgi:serpin B